MGISGHILGERKLQRLNHLVGISFDRAFIRNNECEAVKWTDEGCRHYRINTETWKYKALDQPTHWTSCFLQNDSQDMKLTPSEWEQVDGIRILDPDG